jgi:hypothetical protein
MNSIAVSSSQVGNNCWSPKRWLGGRCPHVFYCHYPEKESCKAVASEIKYIKKNAKDRIDKIDETAKRALEQLEANGRPKRPKPEITTEAPINDVGRHK